MLAVFVIIGCLFMRLESPALAQEFWEKKEMDPRVAGEPGAPGAVVKELSPIRDVDLLPRDESFRTDSSCDGPYPCTFDLYYFKGRTFDNDDPARKNILFIAGGPGQFVDETGHITELDGGDGNAALGALDGHGVKFVEGLSFPIPETNGKHNLVYFHVRGTGLSLVAGTNHRDQYLRAKYVVEDIEKIRQAVLGDRPWDAIYAHSWGTIVAQLYAKKYGQADAFHGRPGPAVRSLILSAPVVRKTSRTFESRRKQTVQNLSRIYQFYRPDYGCKIDKEDMRDSYLKAKVTDFDVNFVEGVSTSDLDQTDNLCFIAASRITAITHEVERILTDIEEDYGSVDFLTDKERFEKIRTDPLFPKYLRRYPREFYVALRTLQMSGAPTSDSLVLTPETKTLVGTSLMLGYYITVNNHSNVEKKCDPDGRFLVGPAADAKIKEKYCTRILAITKQFAAAESVFESERARAVFGVYDGVARWVPKALNINSECFTGKDIASFARARTGAADRKKFLRNYLSRLGVDPSPTPICGWDPGMNAHSVPTLIVTGTSDAITAGCQAEDFYNEGLRGIKVFLEFRGMGHAMTVADTRIGTVPSPQTQIFADLIEKWIVSPADFVNFISGNPSELASLRSSLRKPVDGFLPCQH